MSANIDEVRWARVQARDATADGEFFYGVRTTGVFCRPSCAARPSRANVVFHQTAAEAEAAGFRPCRRCHPLALAIPDPQASLMQDMATQIAARACETLPLARLAAEAGLSPFHFQRVFKAVIGVTPRAYQAAARLRGFKARLRQGADVLGAGLDAGYGSTSRIHEQVTGGLGMTPSAYRAGGAGETIVHAMRPTRLGLLAMAAAARGVCFVEFGESAAALRAALAREFPRARLEPAPDAAEAPLDAWMEALATHLDAGGPHPDLPLELRGTAFQIKVWRFLLRVRRGEVVTYTALAAGVGAPRAVRAAASACAANRLAVLVPCHRALRADGGLGGYRWGLDRKRALLEAEGGDARG